jgi:hypothetical protein
MRFVLALLLLVSTVFMVPSVEAQAPQGDCVWSWKSYDDGYTYNRAMYGVTKADCLHGPVTSLVSYELGDCVWRWTSYDRSRQEARYLYPLTEAQCTGHVSYYY